MHPPDWVCKKIEEVHPAARLGWYSYKRVRETTTPNEGKFVLLQLYHHKDAKNAALNEPWGEKGPVFGSAWDPLIRVPMLVARIDDPQEVFSGAIIDKLKYWCKPIVERIRASALEAGKQYQETVHEQAESMADFMLWHNSKNWQNSWSNRTLTKSDLTDEDKAVLRGERLLDLTQAFMPPPGSVV